VHGVGVGDARPHVAFDGRTCAEQDDLRAPLSRGSPIIVRAESAIYAL
jgi:hypothetical protein